MIRRVDAPDPEFTLSDQQLMEAASRYFRWQYELAAAQIGRRVLEVGCGVGNVTNLLQDRDLIFGIDVEPDCVRRHAERFSKRSNVISQCLDVLDPRFTALAEHDFDSIVCLNVLEHISDDRKALEQMHAVLSPAGRVILIVPAFESLYGPIDAKLGHFRRYSWNQLRQLASTLGFKITVGHYLNVVGFFGWWFNAHVLRKTEQSEKQIRFFDSWIVPTMSKIEGIVTPPFGQNIFAVLCKT